MFVQIALFVQSKIVHYKQKKTAGFTPVAFPILAFTLS
jgi:hypothetical protein